MRAIYKLEFVISILMLLSKINLILCTSLHRRFPDYFQFGCASSAYQVEGAWNQDGKGENIWDYFTYTYPTLTTNHTNGDIACDSYNKYKEDVTLLKGVGVHYYRFSISWARVLPNGDLSNINEKGLQYYDNLIDELLANGIEPMVTIYHWDLPQRLQEIGGWPNMQIIEAFLDYADLLLARYGDRVLTWITFNEPFNICVNGYGTGAIAPGVTSPGVADYLCAHNILISNARLYNLYQDKYSREGGKMGIVLVCLYGWPLNSDDPDDLLSADRGMQFYCGWFMHPIFSATGGYPQTMIDVIANNSISEGRKWSRLPYMSLEDKNYIQGTADFLGLNYYTSAFTTMNSPSCGNTPYNADVCVSIIQSDNWPASASDWLRSIPAGLRELLNWIKDEYENPEIIITENGWSDSGELEDVGRIKYLKEHFEALLDAIEDGVNVVAHTTWSILDNFEWTQGYSQKFGIVRVNFTDATRTRTPKASYYFLQKVIESKIISAD